MTARSRRGCAYRLEFKRPSSWLGRTDLGLGLETGTLAAQEPVGRWRERRGAQGSPSKQEAAGVKKMTVLESLGRRKMGPRGGH